MKGILHGYHLGKIIHTGSAVKLWQAMAPDGNHVVIKTPISSSPSTEVVDALRLEGEALQDVEHEKIIPFVAYREDVKPAMLVIEYFAAPTLETLRNYEPETVKRQMKEMLTQTCEALEHVHEKGYVHRDVKPGNILVDSEGELRLIDFSIARKMNKSWFSRRPKERRIEGSRSYVAPEVLSKKRFDHRADIYSLGIMCYLLFTGKFPFTGNSTQELTLKHLNSPPPALTTHNKRLSKKMNDMVLWMLAKKPEDRPHSVSKVRERLQEFPIYS